VPPTTKSSGPKPSGAKSRVVKAAGTRASSGKQPAPRRESLSFESLLELLQRYRQVRSFSELSFQLRKDNPPLLERFLQLLESTIRPATPVITTPGPGSTFQGGSSINVLANCSRPELPHELVIYPADNPANEIIVPINDPDNPSTCPHGATLDPSTNILVDLPPVAVPTDYYIVIRITGDTAGIHFTHRILITLTP
jgi:hypothetical protein